MLLLSCAAVALAGALYALMPLFGRRPGDLGEGLGFETEAERLLDRKSVVDKNLEDLALDYKMGRLSGADYQRLEAGDKSEAAGILESLEHLDAAIEAAIAAAPAGKKFCADCGRRLVEP